MLLTPALLLLAGAMFGLAVERWRGGEPLRGTGSFFAGVTLVLVAAANHYDNAWLIVAAGIAGLLGTVAAGDFRKLGRQDSNPQSPGSNAAPGAH